MIAVFLSPSVFAAYPEDFCNFTQTNDRTVTAKCSDDTANGSFDGKTFRKPAGASGPERFTLSESKDYAPIVSITPGNEDITCSATITIQNQKATVSGTYLVKTVDDSGGGIVGGTRTSFRCEPLEQIAVSLNRTAVDKPNLEGAAVTGDESATEETTTCGIEGVGWIVCPIMTFMAKLNDSAFGFLQNLLTIQPKLITDAATLKAWEAFRDIANVAFIIAFLMIVYSQITGTGVSNYGIKKLLPRIFVSAVLVNVSYILCALAVDASNIVGSSIFSLLGVSIPVGADGATNGDFANGWQNAVGPILAGGAALIVLLVVVIPVLPMVLLALAVILFIIIARQALVILLIVVAPLAFVAYLLPNTESWFKKWRQAFFTVLMVYPIIGAIFGASMLAATILNGVASNPDTPGDDQQLLKIIALAVLAIPLFAVPLALKGSLAAAGSIGNRLAGLADRTNRRASSDIGDRLGDLNNRRKIAALNGTGKTAAVAGVFGLTKRRSNRDFLRSTRENEAKRADLSYNASRMAETDSDGNYTASAQRMQRAAAGGVFVATDSGQARVLAAAKAANSKQLVEEIDNLVATVDLKVKSDIPELERRFQQAVDTDNVAHQAAYLKMMNSNGSPGIEAMERSLEKRTDGVDHDDEQIMVLKDIMNNDSNFKGAGRSFEVWSNNEASAKALDANGNVIKDANGDDVMTQHANFKAVNEDPGVYADITANRFAGMSKPQQMKALDVLEKADAQNGTSKAQALAQRIMADTTAMGNIKGKPQEEVIRISGGATAAPAATAPGNTGGLLLPGTPGFTGPGTGRAAPPPPPPPMGGGAPPQNPGGYTPPNNPGFGGPGTGRTP